MTTPPAPPPFYAPPPILEWLAKAEAADAELAAWLRRMIAAGQRVARGGAAIIHASENGAPEAIDAALDDARDGLNEADHLLDAAWRGPSKELIAAAAAEYHASRPPIVAPRAAPPKTATRQNAPITLAPRAVAERERLRASWPKQWAAGEAAEIARRGPGPEFHDWPPDARAAFFAAATTVAEKRRGSA